MRVGSIVETVGDFEEVRNLWGFPYPKKGDVLVVSAVVRHPNDNVARRGIVLLYFEELPNLTGVCDKTIDGKPNFIELVLPDDMDETLQELLREEHALLDIHE